MSEFDYNPYKSRRNRSLKLNEEEILNRHLITSDDFYNDNRPVDLEIGSGDGSFILQKALYCKQVNFVASDVYVPGLVQLAKKIECCAANNIRIYMGDARDLIGSIKMMFRDIYILFPDPWFKKKHRKKRLISSDFIEFISNKFSGKLYISTDDPGYVDHILGVISLHKACTLSKFMISRKKYFDTKYESKAIIDSKEIFHFTLDSTNA